MNGEREKKKSGELIIYLTLFSKKTMTTTRPSSQAFPGKIEAKVHSRSRNDRLRARRCTRRYAFCRAFLKNLFIFLRQYEYGLFSCFEWITPFCTYQNAPLCAIIPKYNYNATLNRNSIVLSFHYIPIYYYHHRVGKIP